MSKFSYQLRRTVFDLIGAVFFVSTGVVLMLAYFDVLVK